jgi:hypothetical protein
MISVVVLGQPYWASRVALALNRPDEGMRATFISSRNYPRLIASRQRADRVFLMRVGYRAGGTTPRGRLFDAYWSMLRRLNRSAVTCHYWLGTDVLNTLEELQAGTLRKGVIESIRSDLHLADASWLTEELASAGIDAVTAHVPAAHRTPVSAPPLPAEFSALTYLANLRYDFYGGDTILDAAAMLPDVRFDIVGSTGAPDRRSPPNIRWHGWVSDMPRHYAESTAVIRIPRHDGLGETVVEGLLNARHVIYTHAVPFVRQIRPATPEALAAELTSLRDAHLAGKLQPNLEGREYALVEFDEARQADHLASVLRSRA